MKKSKCAYVAASFFKEFVCQKRPKSPLLMKKNVFVGLCVRNLVLFVAYGRTTLYILYIVHVTQHVMKRVTDDTNFFFVHDATSHGRQHSSVDMSFRSSFR